MNVRRCRAESLQRPPEPQPRVSGRGPPSPGVEAPDAASVLSNQGRNDRRDEQEGTLEHKSCSPCRLDCGGIKQTKKTKQNIECEKEQNIDYLFKP